MATTSKQVAIGIARLLIGLGAGGAIYYMWETYRQPSPDEMYFFGLRVLPLVSGIICAGIITFMISKDKGSGDG